MSNQHKATASRPWLAPNVWKLSVFLTALLTTLLTVGVSSAFAAGSSIQIVQDPPVPTTVVEGGSVTFKLKVSKVAPGTDNLTAVTVSNTQSCALGAKAGDDGDDILEDGETWAYDCVTTATTDGLLKNTAKVTAKTPAGLTIEATSAEQTVTVLNAGVNVTKAVNGASTVLQGATVNFDIVVTNTGSETIDQSKLTFVDPRCTIAAQAGTLAAYPGPGNTATYACAVTNVQDDFFNEVTVTAIDAKNQTWTHSAKSGVVTVKNPGLVVEKTASKATITSGETVKWTIKVLNTGETNLTNITFTDSDNVTGNTDCTFATIAGPLAPGASITPYTCDQTYTDAQVPQSGVIENTVTVVATVDGAAAPAVTSLTKSSVAAVKYVKAGLEVNKTPAIQQVAKDGTAKFTITAKNTGQSDLTDVTIEDLKCTTLSAKTESGTVDNKINAGETWSWACEIKTVTSDFSNVAVVRAKDISGVERNGTAVAFVDMIDPVINITKAANPGGAGPVSVSYGGEVNFNLTVTNNGDTELSAVDVVDTQCDAKPVRTVGTGDKLAAGGSWTYTCKRTSIVSDFENSASVTAVDVLGGSRANTSNKVKVNVLRPDLRLSKEPKLQVVEEGKAIQWTLYVTNVGQIDLQTIGANITDYLIDPMCKTLVQTKGSGTTLAPGAANAWKFTCTSDPAVTFMNDEIKNTATAIFKTAAGATIIDSDSAETEVLRNSLNLKKTARSSVILKDADAIFDFSVSVINRAGTPAQTLSDVVVEDAICTGGKPSPVLSGGFNTGDTNKDNKLQSTEVWAYTCTVAKVQADLTNTAKASAKDSNGRAVSDIDSAMVSVINAQLTVKKSTGTPIVNAGANVTFDIEVSNTGENTLLVNSVIDTPSAGACQGGGTLTRLSGDINNDTKLNKGETWRYACTMANVQNDVTNTVAVSAKDEVSGQAIPGSASATVTVLRPGINLEKIANTTSVAKGGTASFTILVSNAGGTNLSIVNPVDTFCPLVVLSKGNGDAILNVGETWVYSCAVANVQGTNGSFTNVASVTATDANGVPVSAQDDATVTVTDAPVPPPSGNLVLAQTVDPTTVAKGGSATFRATLTNGTANNVTGVSFKGDKCKSFTRLADAPGNNDAVLNSGETWVWSCVLSNIKKSTTNKVTAKITSPKQTLTAAVTVSVLSARGIIIEQDPNEVIEADPADESEREIIDDAEGAEVIDESLLVNKIYLPTVMNEE